MATTYDNVQVAVLTEQEDFKPVVNTKCRLDVSLQNESVLLTFHSDDKECHKIVVNNDTEFSRLGKQGVVFTEDQKSSLVKFNSVHTMKTFQFRLKEIKSGLKSTFSERTDEASAVQYFQFYGYLSQQQNMMQDYIRTSSYQRAILANLIDFHDKVVLDVGAGSGILSFFAIQAGARKVYAIEASSMAKHCEMLVQQNKLADKIIVIPGKVEEVEIPEEVDTIISEPMGYMLFNERMLESFLHAKKWLRPGGKMFPSQGDLHIAPFTDEALYMEQFSKANFWYQQSFHGIDLTSLRSAAVSEYFKQPIVDTFDVNICLAKSNKYTVDFQTADETDLHVIEIPLTFSMLESGLIHGLAFWFDVAFLGTNDSIWLSTAPTETLTHWYQVRCLVETPVLVKRGQTVTGKCVLRCNKRQSYDVDIEVNIPGTGSKSTNTLDLKNPFFRYTGQTPQPPPGQHTTSPSDNYWNSLATGSTMYMNGLINGIDPNMLQQQGVVQTNLIPVSNVAPINPGSIPSVLNLVTNNTHHANRTSVGGGISPVNFTMNTQNSRPPMTCNNLCSATGNNSTNTNMRGDMYPVSNQFMIGDYVMPGNVVVPTQLRKSEAV
ncbi:histone-arginine methyltransferase CARMER-like isoform X1 [Pecten maximus]|uniref:histone-arginine methyltransferase CARMER-like isoform X1 n=2 Tax=Pecten maximus TaxID=6579 RepID=UPI0014583118|nr:histone-arginine methyltransferase CARMER-like isoform X1 [Pecten maximus]